MAIEVEEPMFGSDGHSMVIMTLLSWFQGYLTFKMFIILKKFESVFMKTLVCSIWGLISVHWHLAYKAGALFCHLSSSSIYSNRRKLLILWLAFYLHNHFCTLVGRQKLQKLNAVMYSPMTMPLESNERLYGHVINRQQYKLNHRADSILNKYSSVYTALNQTSILLGFQKHILSRFTPKTFIIVNKISIWNKLYFIKSKKKF